MRGEGDSEPSYEVVRASVFNRLVDEERIGLMDAENWLRAWEAKADEIGRPRGADGYWDEGLRWIIGERGVERSGSN
jgi:hypothetical protein